MVRARTSAATFVHDFATLTLFFGGLVAVLAFGFWIFQIANGSAHVAVTALVPEELVKRPEGASGVMTMWVDVTEASRWMFALRAWAFGLVWTIGLLGLWQLRQVARSAVLGDPFIRDNVQRLRVLGFALLVYSPLSSLVHKVFDEAMLHSETTIARTVAVTPFSWTVFVAAMSVLALSQVFAKGVAMREDLEGTV